MSEKPCSMTVSPNSRTCYFKFSQELHRDSELVEAHEFMKEENKEIEIYIFDMSSIKYVGPSCYRTFTTLQHLARTKKTNIVVVIPPEMMLKRRMMEDGLIRPAEICMSLASLKEFVKGARSKQALKASA